MSEEYVDEIVEYYGMKGLLQEEACYQIVNEDFAVVYRSGTKEEAGNLGSSSFSFPYCFGLAQQENLEVMGVSRVRRIPGFDYQGSGILLGFVDTGIDYRHPVFTGADGVSRVRTIWDQGDQRGIPPKGFLYGTEYGPSEIAAGTAPKDENGHGTFLAGIAAGNEDWENEFAGVASRAEIAVVKLKEAKSYLKTYYCIPENTVAYSEADIMLGIQYLLLFAEQQKKPLVLCLGVSCGQGSHRGTMPLSLYLNRLAYRPGVCLVIAAGNEGNARHHARLYTGTARREVEVSVERRGSGFTLELFAEAVADLKLRVISPAGDETPVVGQGFSGNFRFPFLFDRSVLYVEREGLMRAGTMQRIRLRLQRAAPGIWRIVLEQSSRTSEVNVWLPIREFLEGEVVFLQSDPQVTLCEPGNAPLLLTVGGYATGNNGPAPFSGRGFTADGLSQPTLLAPSVTVKGPFAGGGFVEKSGTSIGAAYTAGTVALFLEYLEEYRASGGEIPVNTVLIRNLFLLGADRKEGEEYPSPVSGYGTINLFGVFEFLREL